MTLAKVAGVSGLCLICLSMGVGLGRTQAQRAGSHGTDSKSQTQGKNVYRNKDLDSSKLHHNNNVASATANRESKGSKGNRSGPKESGSSTALTRYRDSDGHNREYWQKRVKPLRTQLERLDSQIKTLQEQQDTDNPASGIKVSRRGRWRARSQDTGNATSRKIDSLKQKRAEVVKSIQEVEEEARKAQALPEWLR